jgi:hypothetical protein
LLLSEKTRIDYLHVKIAIYPSYLICDASYTWTETTKDCRRTVHIVS